MGKAVLTGALFAVVVAAAIGLGGYAYVRSLTGAHDLKTGDRVALIFESPAQDGAMSATLISTVDDTRMLDVSPETTVSVPGSSYTHLADAFVFGGGGSVVSALGAGAGGSPKAFVSVPMATWRAAVEATRGVSVQIPEEVSVFDGTRLTTIRSGEQTLTADQVSALLRGLPYVTPANRVGLRLALEQQLAAVVATGRPTAAQVDSDLSSSAVELWLREHLARVAKPQVG